MILPKFKTWQHGTDLKGSYLATKKLDWVCVLLDAVERTSTSKRGKPLYNFDKIYEEYPQMRGIFEVYDTNWETSVSLVRNQKSERQVELKHLNRVIPPQRHLHLEYLHNPKADFLAARLQEALFRGEEGLVLWYVDSDNNILLDKAPIKVKPEITMDIRVSGFTEGTGKYKGMLGAFITAYGKVSGMDDATRVTAWNNKEKYLNSIIEVKAMGWTPGNKLRHPRYMRHRWDKDTENLERD